MADRTPEDLSREIERLWARVGPVSAEPSSAYEVPSSLPAASSMGVEAAWETVSILKRQRRQSEAAWEQAMQARDEALRVLRARLESAETELARLRERAEGEDERIISEALDARGKVESAQKAVALAEQRHAEETRALEAAMQSLRERLAAESVRARAAEQRWQSREQQYLLDLKSLQDLAQRREKEVSGAEASAASLREGLAEAKAALEKTLAELLLERRESERTRGERDAAARKADELRAHVDELSRIWQEERGQWRELWDRERSTWESQRGELAQWEESLRREREAWHAELQVKEQAHVALTDDLAGKIRETSLTAERMSELIAGYDRRGADEKESLVQAAARGAALRARRRRLAAGAALALACAAALVPAWRAASAWRFSSEAEAAAPTPNPAAIAFDGSLLWIADWGGTLAAVDPSSPGRIVRQAAPAPGGPYRPTAVAVGGGSLWTLDAAQPRLLRHSAAAPERIVSSRPSPGPAPAALAFDGETVWSYDAVDRALTRHAGDDSPARSYALPDDAVPGAIAWADGRLWVSDAKSKRLLVYALEDGKLRRVAAAPLPEAGVSALAPAGGPRDRRAFALLSPSGARGRAAIVRYRIKRLLPFARF